MTERMSPDVFIAYGKQLQDRARILGYEPCGYRAVPGITRAIVRAPGGTVIKINAHQPDAAILHDMWLGTVTALGIDPDDPMSASFRIPPSTGTVGEDALRQRPVAAGDCGPSVAEGRSPARRRYSDPEFEGAVA